MSDRISPTERNEAREMIERQNQLAREMARARGDVSLDQLEARMNNGFIDESRIERMTQDELRQLRVIDQNLTAILENPAAVQNYPFNEAQADGLFMAEFYNEPLKTFFTEIYSNYSPALHQQFQDEAQADAQARLDRRNGQGAEIEMPEETPGLGLRRVEMLAAPDLDIGSVVLAVRNEIDTSGLNNAQAMQLFRARLVPNVIERLEAWGQANNDFVRSYLAQQGDGSPTGQSEAEMLESMTGITTIGESVVGDVAEGGLNLAGNIGGDLNTALQYNFIENDPLLGQLFNTADSKQPLMASLFSGDFDAHLFQSHVTTQLASLFPDTLEFSRITEQFGTWAGVENQDLTPEQLDDIKEKLETIPRFFIGGEWEDKYHEYLRHEVAGRGAMDFPEWILTQVDGIQRLFFSILVSPMVVTAMNWWMNDAEDEEIDRYGEHWALYDGLTPTTDGDGDTDEEPGEPGDTSPEALAEASDVYKSLLQRYRANVNDPAAIIDIQINGESLGTDNWSEFETELSNIGILIENTPNASPLLAKGLRIQDLNFLALHNGDENTPEDGINAYFEPDGSLRMSYEFEAFWSQHFGNGFDGARDIEIAEEGIGNLGGFIAGYKIGSRVPSIWGKVLGVALGVAGAWAGSEIFTRWDNFDLGGRTLEFDDINAESLSVMIRDIQDDVGVLEDALGEIDLEAFESIYPDLEAHRDKFNLEEIEQNGGIPGALISDNGRLSPAFISMLNLEAEFWGDYQMTRDDLDVFAANLDTSFLGSFGSIDDNEEAIERRNPWFRRDGYFVDGSNLLFEERIENAADLFTWLRS